MLVNSIFVGRICITTAVILTMSCSLKLESDSAESPPMVSCIVNCMIGISCAVEAAEGIKVATSDAVGESVAVDGGAVEANMAGLGDGSVLVTFCARESANVGREVNEAVDCRVGLSDGWTEGWTEGCVIG